MLINENALNRRNAFPKEVQHPIQYVAKVELALDNLIHEDGDYLFMGFAVVCFVAIGWLLARGHKSPLPESATARKRAIIGIMLASPGMSSDADGGRTRLIMGDQPTRYAKGLNSDSFTST